MIALFEKRAALKQLVESGAMSRKMAEKVMEAEAGDKMQMGVSDSGDGHAELVLYDVIDSWGGWFGTSAVEVRQALAGAGDLDRLTVRLNSPGGEVSEGMTIHNMLADHPADVEIVVDGMAASIASIIAMAGDKIVMNRGAEMMIHKSWMVTIGDADFMVKQADMLARNDRQMAAIYAARAGGDSEQWLEAMAEETWYFGAEAVEAGLADESAPLKTKNDSGSASAQLWDRALFAKTAPGDAGDDSTDDAPEDSGDAAATAAATEERQRASRVVTTALVSAACGSRA